MNETTVNSLRFWLTVLSSIVAAVGINVLARQLISQHKIRREKLLSMLKENCVQSQKMQKCSRAKKAGKSEIFGKAW